MTALRTESRPRPGRRTAPTKPASSFEVWSWWFMRISGIILVFLVLIHFAIMHIVDGGIDRVNFAFVAGRWSSPFWQTFDWLMLFLGLIHGTNGLRTIINEYVRSAGKRAAIKAALYSFTFTWLLLGTLVILTFDPNQAAG